MQDLISFAVRLMIAESQLIQGDIWCFARKELDYFRESELKLPNWRGAGKRVEVSMRTLGFWALCAGSAMALASGLFVLAIRHADSAWVTQACPLGGELCQRPSLLLIPILATLAWGMMLRISGK
jgi:hypothetical protein